MRRACILALLGLLLAGASPAAAAGSSASDEQMAAMDRYFSCAFATMRAARTRQDPPPLYADALARVCGPAERALVDRSAELARAQGSAPAAARDKARRTVADARSRMLALYQRY